MINLTGLSAANRTGSILRTWSAVLALIALAMLILPSTASAADVSIADPNLAAAVRSRLGLAPSSQVTADDMLRLYSLTAEGQGIRSLSGLEYASNLSTLRLSDNAVSDLSPLANLVSLSTLDLAGNQVRDLRPLANSFSLRHLSLGYTANSGTPTEISRTNPVEDISPISNLTGLTTLYISNCNVSDLAPLSSLTSLRALSLGGNQISSIDPLTRLTSLTYLTLTKSQVNDISPLEGLASLSTLKLNRNRVEDIGSLVSNSGIGYGDVVTVDRNFLDLTPTSKDMGDIKELLGRGVSLRYEPQNTAEIGVGTNVTVMAGDATVTFAQVTAPGTLTYTPYFGARHPVPGETRYLPDLYFDLHPTAAFSGGAAVVLDVPRRVYPGTLSTLKVIHWTGESWEEPTGLTFDEDARTITFQADSFSDFAVVETLESGTAVLRSDSVSTWSLLATALLGLAAARRSKRLSG